MAQRITLFCAWQTHINFIFIFFSYYIAGAFVCLFVYLIHGYVSLLEWYNKTLVRQSLQEGHHSESLCALSSMQTTHANSPKSNHALKL